MADHQPASQAALLNAERDRATQSSHGGLGAAGYVPDAGGSSAFLSRPGEIAVIDPPASGLPNFEIAVAWDNVAVENEGNILKKMIKKADGSGVDLDLGCLYKLKNGIRGGLQAFGDIHGSLKEEPYIALSADERTGDREGPDETLWINGTHWQDIAEILIYVYIYDGAKNWASVKPQVQVRVPGLPPVVVTLATGRAGLPVCAVASIENVRSGIKLNTHLEYFPGHAEMDRAFGFGLEWESGTKD